MKPADYHMHTPLCRHATGEPSEYAAHALEVGLTEIGMSDHSPMQRDDFDDWRMLSSQLDDYIQKVQKAERDFPQLKIKYALEVDYLPGQEDWIRWLAQYHPWDYLIGSVHYVSETWDLDNPYKLSEWKNRDPFEVWTVYFDRLNQAADSGLFDIIGHADLCKKFCFYPKEDCTHLYERLIKTARKKDIAIEINTAGLRKNCKEMYPSPQILQMAQREGVALTFGSDAHAPNEVGMNFDEAVELAKLCGYRHSVLFDGRNRSERTL
ncbi:MAG: histidinol-phosphatase HisJ family protein [Verrucomicrobiales bacterium]